jgi:hypothetical protein
MADTHDFAERLASGQSTAEGQQAAADGSGFEWEHKQEPAEYYRAAAARARALEQDATTPRIKQHLRELIIRYDRLAGEVGRNADTEPGRNGGNAR